MPDHAKSEIRKYFCVIYDHVGKAELSTAYWNPKRKLVVAMHFFGDNEATIILKNSQIQSNIWHCFQLEALLSLKNAWLPQILFFDTRNTY